MELLVGVGILVAFAVASFAARAMALHWLHPAPRDVGDDARVALAAAERVCGLAQADGGHLPYPWRDGDAMYEEHALRLALETVADRVPDPRLVSALNTVRDSLRTLFAAAAPIVPQVWYSGMPTPPRDPNEEKRRDLQLAAADSGRQAVVAARLRLAILERRARLWFAR